MRGNGPICGCDLIYTISRPLHVMHANSMPKVMENLSRSFPAKLVSLFPAFWLLTLSPASGLIIRHDKPTLDYETYAKEDRFSASCSIIRGSDTDHGITAATAIDSRWGLHARHTLRHAHDYMADGNSAVLRGTRSSGWGKQTGLPTVPVETIFFFDDDFSRFANPIDIALVKTQAPHSAMRIAPVYAAHDEVGRVGSGASAANNRKDGLDRDRKPEAKSTTTSSNWRQTRWAGKNDIDLVNGQNLGSPADSLLRIDLDHPADPSQNALGAETANELEFGTMGGDSGSPIYVDRDRIIAQVAGVLSGGNGRTYGSVPLYVRVSPYRTWITDTILANPDSNHTFTLTGIPDQATKVGKTFESTSSANSSDAPPLTITYRFLRAPEGATIDPVSGGIEWTPGSQFAGTTHRFMIEAAQNGVKAHTVTEEFAIAVPAPDGL